MKLGLAAEQVSKTLFQNLVGFASGDLAMLGYRAIMYAAGLISVMVYLACPTSDRPADSA